MIRFILLTTYYLAVLALIMALMVFLAMLMFWLIVTIGSEFYWK